MVNKYNSIVLTGRTEAGEKFTNKPGVFYFAIEIPSSKEGQWKQLMVKYRYDGNVYLPTKGDYIAVVGQLMFDGLFDEIAGKSQFWYVDAKSITLLPKDSYDFHAEHNLSYTLQHHLFTLAGH